MPRSPLSSARHSKSSDNSPSEVSSRQVQWGGTQVDAHSASTTSSSSSSGEFEDTSDNINERLRHQVDPIMDIELERRYMNRLIAAVCATVVQQASREVMMMRSINNMSKLDINLDYVPLDEKYTSAEHDLGLVLYKSERHLNFQKLRRDLSWLEEILSSVVMNLQRTFYFDKLETILKNYDLTKQEEGTVLAGKEFNKRELQKLRQYISNERREMNKLIQSVTEELGNCKDQLNDNIVENTVKTAYITIWEDSRQEQNKMILEKREVGLSNTKHKMKVEIEKETRIHDEMWSYLEETLEDIQNDIEKWMAKYDQDMEEMEKTVQEKQIRLEQEKEKYNQFLDQFNDRQKKIDEYKAHKHKKRLEAEELERRTHAATRIQSWWRGVMFRKGLGPWRRKKGKGKKGGSAKDSAKKKKK